MSVCVWSIAVAVWWYDSVSVCLYVCLCLSMYVSVSLCIYLSLCVVCSCGSVVV